MRKVFDIPGGIHPPENKEQSLRRGLDDLPVPSKVILPLNLHAGTPAIPCVQVGDSVLRGQTVAEPSGRFSAAIHASISGTVEAIEERPVSHASGLPSTAVVIRSDGSDEAVQAKGIENYLEQPPEALLERLFEMGVVGLGGAGFPSHIKLKPGRQIDTLIINCAECEPYITADHELLRSEPHKVLEGIELIQHLVGKPAHTLIGIEDNKGDAIEALQSAIDERKANIELVVVPTKYPSGGEKQLIQLLTGREVPSGGIPANIGILVHNPGTAVAALEAIRDGKPLTQRITTFTGRALNRPGNYRVRIGAPVGEILEHIGFDSTEMHKIVFGGPMMGFAMNGLDNPVLKITNCVLVPDRSELPDPPIAQPCIRCGACAEACPASLLPQQLLWFAQSGNHDALQSHNLFDCIECGACSYVCPSNIPLVQYYRAAKGEIREAERERIAADRARVRFETRNERLEREAAEKEARRKERAAKAQNAARSGEPDLVAAAMARVKQSPAGNNSAADERRLSSLKERIDKLEQEIPQTEDLARRKKLEAELADARVRLDKHQTQTAGENSGEADEAQAAIERAKQRAMARAAMPESEKLKDSIASLEKRIAAAETKVEQARNEESDTLEALENGLQKLQDKLQQSREQLAQIESGATS